MPQTRGRSRLRGVGVAGAVVFTCLGVVSCASVGARDPFLMAGSPGDAGSLAAEPAVTGAGPSAPAADGVPDEGPVPGADPRPAGAVTLAAMPRPEVEARPPEEEEVVEEFDPWEPFNERMFSFNWNLDRFVVKPVARVWEKILPDPVQRSLSNAFRNLGMPRRLVNNLLQGKLTGAGQELARFLLNSTAGVAGFFDVAKRLGIEKSDEDTGQTLGVYGVGPGPYLVLPFLPPLTVRDGIGLAVDGALDPFKYVVFPALALTGIGVADRVNDRSITLELFEAVEETTVDLYTAVRNAYLQRRKFEIER